LDHHIDASNEFLISMARYYRLMQHIRKEYGDTFYTAEDRKNHYSVERVLHTRSIVVNYNN
jgi:hypothetical protein